MRPPRPLPPRAQQGFSMLEVLIAILIAAFGMLGIAGMQLQTLKSSHGSNLRGIATLLAYDISDRVRANRKGYEAGAYDKQAGSLVATCFSTGCPSSEMAKMDVYLWKASVAAALPGGQAIVCTDATPNDGTPAAPACDTSPTAPYVIKIWWDERDGTGNLQRFTTAFRL